MKKKNIFKFSLFLGLLLIFLIGLPKDLNQVVRSFSTETPYSSKVLNINEITRQDTLDFSLFDYLNSLEDSRFATVKSFLNDPTSVDIELSLRVFTQDLVDVDIINRLIDKKDYFYNTGYKTESFVFLQMIERVEGINDIQHQTNLEMIKAAWERLRDATSEQEREEVFLSLKGQGSIYIIGSDNVLREVETKSYLESTSTELEAVFVFKEDNYSRLSSSVNFEQVDLFSSLKKHLIRINKISDKNYQFQRLGYFSTTNDGRLLDQDLNYFIAVENKKNGYVLYGLIPLELNPIIVTPSETPTDTPTETPSESPSPTDDGGGDRGSPSPSDSPSESPTCVKEGACESPTDDGGNHSNCGNGRVDDNAGIAGAEPEECDGDVHCDPNCKKIPYCGDGKKDPNEACDEGVKNGKPGSSCTDACQEPPEVGICDFINSVCNPQKKIPDFLEVTCYVDDATACGNGQDLCKNVDCNDGEKCIDGKCVPVEAGSPSPSATPDMTPTPTVNPSSTPDASPSPSASPAECGNKIEESGEECDDGNKSNNDGCDENCKDECGNRKLDYTEQCDKSAGRGDSHCQIIENNPKAYCNDRCFCKIKSICGDGIVEGSESCESGSAERGDNYCKLLKENPDAYCSNCSCQVDDRCANGKLEEGSECDSKANSGLGDSYCQKIKENKNYYCEECECRIEKGICGNTITEGQETCDDGNTINNDGCDSQCKLECGNGTLNTNEECDDSNRLDGDGCNSICEFECGNGINDPNEECDDGNQDDSDECTNKCKNNVCCICEWQDNGNFACDNNRFKNSCNRFIDSDQCKGAVKINEAVQVSIQGVPFNNPYQWTLKNPKRRDFTECSGKYIKYEYNGHGERESGPIIVNAIVDACISKERGSLPPKYMDCVLNSCSALKDSQAMTNILSQARQRYPWINWSVSGYPQVIYSRVTDGSLSEDICQPSLNYTVSPQGLNVSGKLCSSVIGQPYYVKFGYPIETTTCFDDSGNSCPLPGATLPQKTLYACMNNADQFNGRWFQDVVGTVVSATWKEKQSDCPAIKGHKECNYSGKFMCDGLLGNNSADLCTSDASCIIPTTSPSPSPSPIIKAPSKRPVKPKK